MKKLSHRQLNNQPTTLFLALQCVCLSMCWESSLRCENRKDNVKHKQKRSNCMFLSDTIATSKPFFCMNEFEFRGQDVFLISSSQLPVFCTYSSASWLSRHLCHLHGGQPTPASSLAASSPPCLHLSLGLRV